MNSSSLSKSYPMSIPRKRTRSETPDPQVLYDMVRSSGGTGQPSELNITNNITLSWDKTKGGSNALEQACAVQGIGYAEGSSGDRGMLDNGESNSLLTAQRQQMQRMPSQQDLTPQQQATLSQQQQQQLAQQQQATMRQQQQQQQALLQQRGLNPQEQQQALLQQQGLNPQEQAMIHQQQQAQRQAQQRIQQRQQQQQKFGWISVPTQDQSNSIDVLATQQAGQIPPSVQQRLTTQRDQAQLQVDNHAAAVSIQPKIQQPRPEQVDETQVAYKEEPQIVTNMVIQRLLTHLAAFENKVSLNKIVNDVMAEAVPIQEFYRIHGHPMVYAGQPTWSLPSDEFGTAVLKGDQPIGDLRQYLAFNRHLPFVVLRTYDSSPPSNELRSELQPFDTGKYQESDPSESDSSESESNLHLFDSKTKATITSQEIIPVSPEMVQALTRFFRNFTYLRIEDAVLDFQSWLTRTGILKTPFVFWYRTRSVDGYNGSTRTERMLVEQLRSYIHVQYGQEFARVDNLLDRGVITFPYINYLAVPGEPWIAESEDKHTYGCITTGWALSAHQENYHRPRYQQEKAKPILSWRIPEWHYEYCGHFYKRYDEIEINSADYDLQEEIDLQTLRPVPMRYANAALLEKLKRRGELFWRFRNRQLVSYNEDTGSSGEIHTDRYMIDFEIYLQLHPDSKVARLARDTTTLRDAIAPSQASDEHPPAAPKIYLFPPQIVGYNLRTKKWLDLDVDRMENVVWNKKAFDYLVLNPDTKELVLALVTNKLAADRGADLIENKGKGLILLLHGGPGTGKTLTAESVAEIAEKPLFRVTCADVGIQPEAVEKYLDSVFRFAKRWDCVVLLDEADVFLEKRTLDDLSRNALVTVFLRVLEYYEGILILTSNRVGTFDEAFKSRIQLSLHYENLQKPQRIKIWKNFMHQLKSLDDIKIDFDDVESYIDELATHELNGRQIRNSITTARQLAQYKNLPMTYAHLKHVIEVASKFDTYIQKVQDGYTDEQIARQDGLR